MFFERPDQGEAAILVHIDFYPEQHQERLIEFQELVKAAGVTVVDQLSGKGRAIHPKSFLSKGKLETLTNLVKQHNAEVVLFNHPLSPGQERNLEQVLQCRVLDRTGVILDIFSQRARTYEGKLQVELAQLVHLSTRLIRGWTHLERQKGGIGLRGPGETQLETDRRLVRVRIQSIKKRLQKVQSSRAQSRQSRSRNEIPTIALVGYTNAGKSTLFNLLTQASVLVQDQLFATLDPTLRKVDLPHYGPVILADTVGFIRDLPHQLVDAFKATLEEVVSADLLLFVVDSSHPERHLHQQQVLEVLQEIKADQVPRLLIYNKIDNLSLTNEHLIEPHIEKNLNENTINRVWLSALKDQGIEYLFTAIRTYLGEQWNHYTIKIPMHLSKLRAQFYAINAVTEESISDSHDWLLQVYIQPNKLARLTDGNHSIEIYNGSTKTEERGLHTNN